MPYAYTSIHACSPSHVSSIARRVVTSIFTNVHDNCKARNLTVCGEHAARPSTGVATVGTAIDICRNITTEPNRTFLKQSL